MSPPPLILTEGGPALSVALSGAEYGALTGLGIVTATPTLTEGVYGLFAVEGVAVLGASLPG